MKWKKQSKSERLASDKVANGNWNPDNRKVKFDWNNSDNHNPNMGARLEISRKELLIEFLLRYKSNPAVYHF